MRQGEREERRKDMSEEINKKGRWEGRRGRE